MEGNGLVWVADPLAAVFQWIVTLPDFAKWAGHFLYVAEWAGALPDVAGWSGPLIGRC